MKKYLIAMLLSSSVLIAQPNDRVNRLKPLDAQVVESTNGFYVEPNLPGYTKARLRVVGAEGEVLSQFFASGEDLVFSATHDMADGSYSWELLVWDTLAPAKVELHENFSPANAGEASPRWVTSGSLQLVNGAVTLETQAPTADADVVPLSRAEGGLETITSSADNHNSGTFSAGGNACVGDPICNAAYQPIDDFEVLDSGGNARILFRNSTTNPTVYWDVGSTPFSFIFEDETTAGTPDILTLEEGGRDHALYVDSSGRIGFGTDSPAEPLHISAISPYIRLDNGSRPWDLKSNSGFMWFSNNGSSFPFGVSSDAPNASLWISDLGRIGLGTTFPSEAIELEDTTGTKGTFLIDQQGADASVEVMFNLVCNCAPGFRMQNSVNGQTWFFRHTSAGDFSFDDPNSAGQEMRLTPSGNLFINGSLSQGSSRALKEHLTPFSGDDLLQALDSLALYEWSYIDQNARHFGPMAEDFAEAYGFGKSNTKIAPADVAGVALAAAKTLREKNVALEEKLHSVLVRLSAVEQELQQQ